MRLREVGLQLGFRTDPYFVTYYDAAVFDQVAVTASGILSYRLKSDFVVSERTYMNIVLQVKE